MKTPAKSATVMPKMHFTPAHLLVLLCVLLASGALLWVGMTLLIAWSILTPPRMSAGKAIYHLRRLSPGDLGLEFEELNFAVREERTGKKQHIAGWWIPYATSTRTVILLHGYADAKIGAIAWAPLFHNLGCNILAIDLRAHGDSSGRFCTGGYFERDDTNQVIDQLRAQQPEQTAQLILFGISLGSAVATAVAAMREDLSAIILESPFPSYKKVIAQHAGLMNLPTGLMIRTATWLAQKISRSNFAEVGTAKLLPSVHCPVFTIVGAEDELLDSADIQELKSVTVHNAQNEFWLAENTRHLQALLSDPVRYQERIKMFLTELENAALRARR